MKIRIATFGDEEAEFEIDRFVEQEMLGLVLSGGKLEATEETVNNMMGAFGKLINRLTELNVLDVSDIKTISGVIDGIELVK